MRETGDKRRDSGYCVAPCSISTISHIASRAARFSRARPPVYPAGHKVGLVGRNGAGKTTLLRLINGELSPDDGSVSWPKSTRLGYVAQEAPGGDVTLIDWILEADTERSSLLAEAETATDPGRIADIQIRLSDIDAHSAPARAARILSGLGFDDAAQKRTCREFSGGWRMRLSLGAVLFMEPELLSARRADQLPRPRRHDVARELPDDLPAHRSDRQPRPRSAQSMRSGDPAPRSWQADSFMRAATMTSRRRAASGSAWKASCARSRRMSALTSRASSTGLRRKPARRSRRRAV